MSVANENAGESVLVFVVPESPSIFLSSRAWVSLSVRAVTPAVCRAMSLSTSSRVCTVASPFLKDFLEEPNKESLSFRFAFLITSLSASTRLLSRERIADFSLGVSAAAAISFRKSSPASIASFPVRSPPAKRSWMYSVTASSFAMFSSRSAKLESAAWAAFSFS